ncbi:hypothetical protein Tco_0859961 [Tanacetum coccineum]|uniref:Uncharacterized protein n=1 Tax=Tanacetum coccineum TaxID=301880 RepID=A0ABQ5BFB4_9ASTR
MMEDFMKRINQQREQEALLVAQREQELREQEQAAQEKEEFSPKPVFRQLIEEMCGTKVCEEQKQNMEDTMLDLLEDCRQKELYCIHNNVDDLIESALNSKLLLINLNSQRFDKEKQEVKNIVEQATKRRTRITGDEHLNTISETEKSSVENLVPIPNISITSPKIDFLPEEFVGELDIIDEDGFDEEEGEIDIDIFQIEDEILREKLLNVNLLIDKIEALNLIPSIPFYSTPPGIESDFDSEGDIIFLDDLLNDDPIPEYEHFTFDIWPDALVLNNFDELNEDECFDPGGGEIVFSQNVEDDDSFTFVIRTFLPYLTYLGDSPLLLSTGCEDTIFDPDIST